MIYIMKCRNIKIPPDKNIFYSFLNSICYRENNNLIFYDELFNKNKDIIENYATIIKSHYHKSKQFYVTNIDFRKTFTFIKQLCRYFFIDFTLNRKYMNSSYKLYLIIHNVPQESITV